ncbi:UNVERIFIED_CONTAM: hypothetical protein GTU68_057681 [Idotea baltica]|nr:hypothetical protein [Idotea baltica]
MLKAITPIDGRYANKTEDLAEFFSEYALIKYRVQVEINYFVRLLPLELEGLTGFPENMIDSIRAIASNFSEADAEKVKEIEARTNHDVKAVEYFIKDRFKALGAEKYSEFIHFGLTSQDINNTAVPLSIKEALDTVYVPLLHNLVELLQALSKEWRNVPMLARTHGQPASPTILGKELYVFVERLQMQIFELSNRKVYAKFGGAVGNLNAHVVTYPSVDWITFSEEFIESLGLKRLRYTTQIDHYDQLAAIFQNMARINTILVDMSRDIWTYISMNYFTQKIQANEVGSSTMPHKVNPIDFENAEGNLGMANAVLNHLADKLPISRLQRDLTDSTVLRNVGVPFAHVIIALKSLIKGLGKLNLNAAKLEADLESNWAVVAEAYQTILRREGVAEPYELLKAFTRGKAALTKEQLYDFVDSLPVEATVKEELKRITPHNYTGVISW